MWSNQFDGLVYSTAPFRSKWYFMCQECHNEIKKPERVGDPHVLTWSGKLCWGQPPAPRGER